MITVDPYTEKPEEFTILGINFGTTLTDSADFYLKFKFFEYNKNYYKNLSHKNKVTRRKALKKFGIFLHHQQDEMWDYMFK